MSPPYLAPGMSGTMQSYAHAFSHSDDFAWTQPAGRPRHDSMLPNSEMVLRPVDLSGAKFGSEYLDASPFAHDPHNATPNATLHSTRPATLKKQDSFRFLVTTNPTQFKDKTLMRGNRKFVMNDFLRKERCKTPGTRDIRAEGPAEVEKKRKRLELDAKKARKSRNTVATRRVPDTGVLTPQSSNDGTASSLLYGSDTEGTVTTLAPRTHTSQYADSHLALVPRSVANDEEDEFPMCTSAGDGTTHHPVTCNCQWPEQEGQDLGVHDLFSVLGFKVSPYHTWLQSANTAVDLEKLKFACGRRLRSCSMAKLWLPNLIRARHSFLSTICISAAHDEAMQSVVFGSESLSLRGSKKAVVYERLAVKNEVIAMINSSLDDPDQMTSDSTIIAVMNIFNSEIIGCDAGALKAHQNGLNRMISLRGGLDKLGVNSILQENAADDMYLLYARARATPPPLNDTLFPESPIYCGRDFVTTRQILGHGSDSLRLLELLQKMTCVFRAEGEPNTEALAYFHRQVVSYKSRHCAGESARQDHIYEAIRLTARIYADALTGNMDFSKAAAFSTSPTDSSRPQHARSPAAYVEIVRHLMHTDLDRMWGGLSGTLFFIVMVAGAAAQRAQRARPKLTQLKLTQVQHPTPAADLTPKASLTSAASPVYSRQEEEARRWLAAVAVRCSIILGFEHGGATLGTFQNMLFIQDKLSGRDAFRRVREVGVGPERRGVETAVAVRSGSGFGEFAWEFERAGRVSEGGGRC